MFSSKVIVKNPRKPYKCLFCRETISGEHVKRTSMFDGEVVSDRMHTDCDDFMLTRCSRCGEDLCYDPVYCFKQYHREDTP